MDTKAAFDKEAFEKAAAELTGYKPEFILSQRTGDDYEFGSGLNAYWHFWKESRAAIEIDINNLENHPDDYFMDGYNDAISDVTDELTSHGIRIKGKTE